MGLLITLILVGLLLVLAEVFLIPGLGVTGILGLLSMAGSCWYAFHAFDNTTGCIVLAVVLVSLLVIFILMLRAKTWKRMTLDTNIDAKAVESAEEKFYIGDRGRAITRLAPMGTVRFHAETCEAKALEGMIDPGTEVEIVLIEDNRIIVKPVVE